jgi:TDG/mug DNA glycosylase family protein
LAAEKVSVLPDYLAPGLRVVFCGTAAGLTSSRRQHYYSGPGNEFWPMLYESGLLSEPLTPEQDARILTFGSG